MSADWLDRAIEAAKQAIAAAQAFKAGMQPLASDQPRQEATEKPSTRAEAQAQPLATEKPTKGPKLPPPLIATSPVNTEVHS